MRATPHCMQRSSTRSCKTRLLRMVIEEHMLLLTGMESILSLQALKTAIWPQRAWRIYGRVCAVSMFAKRTASCGRLCLSHLGKEVFLLALRRFVRVDVPVKTPT